MKIIKRGQLAMLSISFMIMIAGYINYKYDPEREKNLGQTVKVDGSEVYLYSSSDTLNIYEETNGSLKDKDENIYKNKSEVSSLETFRMSRDNMFSELETTYRELSENTAVSSNEVNIYKEKLDDVIKKKHLINIVEGIFKAKGIADIVIVPTEDNYNVMVELEETLTKSQVAMIKQIIEEEFKISADKIKIMQK